jgi:hypothetical protein
VGKKAQCLTREVRHFLELQKWLVWANRSGCAKIGERFVKFQEAGLPDLMALRDGFVIAIEIKAGKDQMRPAQEAWADEFIRHGGRYFIVRTLNDLQGL